MVNGKGHRVSAADRKVAGVQAELDLRAAQDLVHVLGSLDQGADVRMQDLGQAVFGAYARPTMASPEATVVPLVLIELEGAPTNRRQRRRQ